MSLWKHQKCYVPLNLQGTQTSLKQHCRSSEGGLCCNWTEQKGWFKFLWIMCKFICKYTVHSTVLLTRVAVKCLLDSVFTCNWMAFTDLAMWMWSFKHLLPDTVTSIFWDNRCCIMVCTFRIQFNGCICKKKKKAYVIKGNKTNQTYMA